MRFARELGLDAPLVGYQGGLIRDMPEEGSHSDGRLLLHTPLSAAVAREIVEWTRSMGLDPHLNRLERFILRADDPHADDYSAFMGARAELAPDLIAAIRHPITKVLAVGDAPLPTEVAPSRASVSWPRRRDHQPSAVPRVRGSGRVEGSGDPLARPPR